MVSEKETLGQILCFTQPEEDPSNRGILIFVISKLQSLSMGKVFQIFFFIQIYQIWIQTSDFRHVGKYITFYGVSHSMNVQYSIQQI